MPKVILTSRLTQHNYTQTHQSVTNETYKDISREQKISEQELVKSDCRNPIPTFQLHDSYLQIYFILAVFSFSFFFLCLLTLYWSPRVFLCWNARLLVISAQLVIKFSVFFSFLYLLAFLNCLMRSLFYISWNSILWIIYLILHHLDLSVSTSP